MTEDDLRIVEHIISAYQTKGLTPKRFYMGLVVRNDIYCSNPSGEMCAIGVVIINHKATIKITDENNIEPYQVAADILNISVSVTRGIASGFDSGNINTIGPADARGVAIGAEVAERLFKKPKKYQTIT